jgi:hypothetical protein
MYLVDPVLIEIATFMRKELLKKDYLYQVEIVKKIAENYGASYLYINKNGNQAISTKVLRRFKKLTPDYVWEIGSKSWRHREDQDPPQKRKVRL